MLGIKLRLMKDLHYLIGLNKGITKIRKRTIFRKQPLDNKLFLKKFANNTRIYVTHVFYLLLNIFVHAVSNTTTQFCTNFRKV